MSCNGMLASLLATTALCAFVSPWATALIGLVAGFMVCFGVWFFDNVAQVDDPCRAVLVHRINGAWGLIALGLFADGAYGTGWNDQAGEVTGLFYGDTRQFFAQLISVAGKPGLRAYRVDAVVDAPFRPVCCGCAGKGTHQTSQQPQRMAERDDRTLVVVPIEVVDTERVLESAVGV